MKKYKLAILPGDGIGDEVMAQAIKILNHLKTLEKIDFDYHYADVGGVAIDKHGVALPASTLKICEESQAILFGSVGGPKWENLPPEQQPERAALLKLRKHFDLYANIRPIIIYDALIEASPLKNTLLQGGLDIVVIRELSSGIYFGTPKGKDSDHGYDTMIYRRSEVERIAKIGFEMARGRKKILTSIDKANVLSSMVLWREVVSEVSQDYPDVTLNHMYVDNAAMQLIRNPKQFDVMLCGNMFGDILSDAGAMLSGSLGMLASASLTSDSFGLYEPSGGSAPDIAGKNIANPIAQILSGAMLLNYTLNQTDAATRINDAIKKVLALGYRTADIYQPENKHEKLLTTNDMGDVIKENL